MKIRGKSGQLTIFIIFGLIIAIGVVILYYFVISPATENNKAKDPQKYIQDCLDRILKSSEEKLLVQAGYRNSSNYLVYNETKVPYLCYVKDNEKLCTILEPLLKNKIEQELKLDSEADLEKCFVKVKEAFEGYDYQEGQTNYSIEIAPNSLIARVFKNIKVSRDDSSFEFNYFEYKKPSPIFDFVILANDILTQETTCNCGVVSCSADVLSLSRMNQRYEVSLFVSGKNEKVYTIKDTLTQMRYLFSVRNCVRLP
jgi:regulatory protein YycH of two-component signal transduction system YycFG